MSKLFFAFFTLRKCTNYEENWNKKNFKKKRVRWKIIDDYCFYYLNDLFGIKLIILRSELNVASFQICMDAAFFDVSRFNNFLLIDATDRSKISSDQKRLFFALSLYPLSFFAKTPLKRLKNGENEETK